MFRCGHRSKKSVQVPGNFNCTHVRKIWRPSGCCSHLYLGSTVSSTGHDCIPSSSRLHARRLFGQSACTCSQGPVECCKLQKNHQKSRPSVWDSEEMARPHRDLEPPLRVCLVNGHVRGV